MAGQPERLEYRIQRFERRVALPLFDLDQCADRNLAHPGKLGLLHLRHFRTQPPDRCAKLQAAVNDAFTHTVDQQPASIDGYRHANPQLGHPPLKLAQRNSWVIHDPAGQPHFVQDIGQCQQLAGILAQTLVSLLRVNDPGQGVAHRQPVDFTSPLDRRWPFGCPGYPLLIPKKRGASAPQRLTACG